ncbi:metal ABC transporter permease [Rhodospirillum rubrum]|uniref:ABC-3 transporter component n=1 Tax=Rhodospirillum rubrum (strain ATCC 11170 / ATH 1.1.1 / DSM 467 / LMG 4362 / NCIMB 8255 / S1) TaxID=269796 RepID=Q2RQA6_RHORT|nr:metal ABC transporter permease [Rhodospirillum rubrum]ABC23689.1 ABC-3 transporter component [Rhodospirillum rubrum ATCC 11170]AEO49427.1 ABC-3 transporter component [Rhodospirillum rubrum F11]MBK5955365.1 metal ABC transporter permease [Rhodospirillum rubrum]QXG79648.1 metal ABC transporter permease [Rhodospirillum rubrum]HAQ01351.1 metal ABC transporter permease [Rhodospirillum rubrum]
MTGSWLETLLLPFTVPFLRDAMIIALLVAVPTALLSCFLVLKGWALMGDAISHAVLPGVVLAYVAGLPLGVGAFAAGLGCALVTGYLKDNSRIKQDTVMGVVFSGMFGLGIVLHTSIRTDVHLDHILFGDMLGVGSSDLLESGLIALLVVGAIALKGRDLLLHAFDPQQARAIGLPVGLLHYGLLCLLALTIVGALKATGILLTVALLIGPGAIAFLFTRRFSSMLLAAVVISSLASVLGVYISLFLDSAPAPTIVLLLTLTFIAAFMVSRQRDRQRARGVDRPV